LRTYHLFISHSWTYSNAYERLKRLLDEHPTFHYTDFSIPRFDPVHTSGTDRELYEAILNKMRPCSAILILAGVYSTHSKWIRAAKQGFLLPKPLIGIIPRAQINISSAVSENVDAIVGWNKNSVVNAIKRLTE
jgi:hypothetical protein